MDPGRIEMFAVATTSGNVILERFYARYSEQEKAEMRECLADAAKYCSTSTSEHREFASRYRDSAVAVYKEGDLHFFLVGSGSHDELYSCHVLQAVVTALREIIRKTPTEALLLDNYARLCLILDEMIYEGFLDKTDAEQINRGIMMKVE